MSDCTVFLTGGTGFIGRRLLDRLVKDRRCRLRALRRLPGAVSTDAGVEAVIGDLRDAGSYERRLVGCDVIVHLAGVTGNAAPEDYVAANVDGTRALIGASRRAGVSRMIFVSSIAATFPADAAYHYARSKQRAEASVRESGLNFLIVRPTIVLGRDSPIWARLRGLAQLPIMPILGDGTARVQPILVDDVAAFLAESVEMEPLPDRAVDLGGPDTMTFEALLRRIRRAVRGRETGAVHLPIRPLIRGLAAMERWGIRALPVSAGQFAAFTNDTVAADDPLVRRMLPRAKTVDEMVRELTADA